MANRRVLVVDDDVKTVDLVKIYLNRDGYKVLTAHNGVDALALAREQRPDLIVLDVMLPAMDGLQVCRTLRAESDVPIIMLTARTSEDDRLAGLDLGADDYVVKPFSPKELAARVRAVLRRLPDEEFTPGPAEIRHGNLSINFPKREATMGGRALRLTTVEFKLLSAFVREPERVFSRGQLIEKALGYDFEGFDRTIDVHILNLRRKLEPDPNRPRYIKTIYGGGYKFVGDAGGK